MASDKRPPLTMVCTECKAQNYVTTKNKTNVPDRMEFNKYCSSCRSHKLHREKR
ncbi:MAG: 50S ribosomal protein L33 [Actinomycetota bacterium]|jgi:large subunit ribosomal protein L33|nr:50S ribosomal protein L33 [Actinomycetota bacterium]MDA3008217.1 50S ribosomal protein L33 [Actinomycetota bacterium]MDA3037084.1 50S ribosomal protein L33 [Actinomycetota bacterium]